MPADLNAKIDEVLRRFRKLEERLGHLEHRLAAKTEPRRDHDSSGSSPFKKTARGKVVSALLHGVPSKLLWLITTVATVFGLLATWVSLRYDVSAMPYVSLNPSDPSAARFLITNEGPFTINDVGYACKFVPPHQAADRPFFAFATVTVGVPSLRSHGAFSAYCKLPDSYPRPVLEGTLLDVEVIYTPKFLFWRHNFGGELMMLKFDQSHSAVWLPVKDMTLQLDDLRKLSCGTCNQ